MANPTSNFGWQMPTPTDLVTDLPADFEVFGQAVDTSLADLQGGTTGQILAKASNTNMDFTWITNDVGDITAVNVTAPITGGGSSGAVTIGVDAASTSAAGVVQLSDSTSTTSSVLASTPTATKSAYDLAAAAIPKSTVTTAGDVIYATGSGAVTRLGIGTAGQVLKVNSGATAPEWGAAGSSGKVLQVIQGTTSTATTINGGVLADTNLTATITPSATNSKVLVMISQYCKNTSVAAATEVGFQMKLLRGATGIAGDASALYFEYFTGASTTFDKRFIWNLHYLDSPSTTSATTYKTQAKNYSASIVAQADSTMSTIILLEIGA